MSVRALSQAEESSVATLEHSRSPQRNDPRGGRLPGWRLTSDGLARRERLPQGQPGHPARRRSRDRRARVRPQPGRPQPGHPAQRLHRRRHHGAGRPAVQRPVLPAPPPRDQRGAVGPRPPARPADARLDRATTQRTARLPRPPATSTGRCSSACTATTRCPSGSPPRGIPMVVVGRPPRGDRRRATSTSTTGGGARSAVDHLIAGGRRVIATIAGPDRHGRRRRPACRLP